MAENTRGGLRKNAGRKPVDKNLKKNSANIYITNSLKNEIDQYGTGNSFSEKAVELIEKEIKNRKKV